MLQYFLSEYFGQKGDWLRFIDATSILFSPPYRDEFWSHPFSWITEGSSSGKCDEADHSSSNAAPKKYHGITGRRHNNPQHRWKHRGLFSNYYLNIT
jgi:hypothetical protein